jgi:hypothetical protein
MTGASKLVLDDVMEIRELIKQGFNDSQIASTFVPKSKKKISREHVSSIRTGKRWNPDNHSFLVKEHLPINEEIFTHILEDTYTTELSVVVTKNGNYHIFMRYINETFIEGMDTPLLKDKPSTEEMLEYHNKWVWDEISKIG